MRARPLVAVVGSLEARAGVPELVVPVVYLDAIERAGGLPVLLHPQPLLAAKADAVLQPFDALVLAGGGDVDPATYGQSPGVALYGVDRLRDDYEIALLGAAAERRMPVLAICRGLQVVNVARGGTLHQHISDREGLEAHGTPNGGAPTVHRVTVVPGSRLAAVMGTGSAQGSCHHHQAVAEVGAGLKAVAATGDGLVEALETEDGDMIAVQWHPEDTAASDPAQQRLFDWLVTAAQRAGEPAQPLV